MNANETITMQFKADYTDREQRTPSWPRWPVTEVTTTWRYTKSDPLVIRISVEGQLHYVIERESLAKILGVPGAAVPAGELLVLSMSGQSLLLQDCDELDANIRFPAAMAEEFYYATTEIVVPGEETPAIWAAIDGGLAKLLGEAA